jgi:hypothetical protein
VITNEIVVDSRRESDDEWWLVEGFQACLVRSWARADGTIAWVRTADDEPGLVCVCVWLVRWPMAVPQLSLSLPRASHFLGLVFTMVLGRAALAARQFLLGGTPYGSPACWHGWPLLLLQSILCRYQAQVPTSLQYL